MGTRKNHKSKKSKRKFRKTRSKRQRGGMDYDIPKSNATFDDLFPGKEDLYIDGESLRSILRRANNPYRIKQPTENWTGKEKRAKQRANEMIDNLIRASQDGDTEKLNEALNTGVDVNAKSIEWPYGWTALHHAIQNGDPKMVKMLLDAGADVNAKNDDGETAIESAKSLRQTKVIDLIEERIRNQERRMVPEITATMRRTTGENVDPNLSRFIGENYLGGKRKSKKSKRKTKTRKTRSKKQRGGMYRNRSRPKNYMACGVMYNNEGKILMAKRKSNNPNHPNKWEFPGGKQEDGETIFECLEREWKEEMNLFIDITPPPLASMKCGRNICQFLVGKILDEDELELKEVAEVKYLTENEILELDDDLLLDKNDKLVIQKLINEGGINRILYLEDFKIN